MHGHKCKRMLALLLACCTVLTTGSSSVLAEQVDESSNVSTDNTTKGIVRYVVSSEDGYISTTDENGDDVTVKNGFIDYPYEVGSVVHLEAIANEGCNVSYLKEYVDGTEKFQKMSIEDLSYGYDVEVGEGLTEIEVGFSVEGKHSIVEVLGIDKENRMEFEEGTVTIDEALAMLPTSTEVKLENGDVVDVNISWEGGYYNSITDRYYMSIDSTEYNVGIASKDLPYVDILLCGLNASQIYADNPNSTVKLDKALGCNRDVVEYLTANANTYLGTPYSHLGTGLAEENCMSPGYSMNCTGFVAHVLRACGADLSRIGKRLPNHYRNAGNWNDYVHNNNINSYKFSTISAMLSSGKLEKGDVIFFEPNSWGSGADNHMGFFWGDSPSDNVFWHSFNPGGNQISTIQAKYSNSTVYVFKNTHEVPKGKLSVQKASGNSSFTSGNSNYSLQGAVYNIWKTDGWTASTPPLTTMTTDANGYAVSGDLDVGTYWVQEKTASPGYNVESTWGFATVTSNATAVTYFGDGTGNYTKPVHYEPPQSGKLSVQKKTGNSSLTNLNSNYSLQGAVYNVYKVDGWTESSPAYTTITTDANGYAVSGDLPLGSYWVQEKDAPKGYKLDKTWGLATVTNGTTAVTKFSDGSNYTSVTHNEPPKSGKLELTKVSANPDCTNNNTNYSLAGAEYTIYKDAACTQYYAKITTDANGKASYSGMPLGVYYLKETKASTGYKLDKTVYTVNMSDATGVNEKVVAITSKEVPRLDPVTISLKKVDSETGGAVADQGTLYGAQFEVKFYSDIQDTDPALDGKTPIRKWVLQTDTDGELLLDDAYKVSGDDFWYDSIGLVSLPYGTITFKEIKAPSGYLINDTVIVVPITGSVQSPDPVYQIPTQPEKSLQLNLVKTQSGTDVVIPGVTFEWTRPDGSVGTYTTDENGAISFKGLTWGNHKIKEVATVDGMAINTNEITFTVSQTNKVTFTSSAVETDTDGNIKLSVNSEGNVDVDYQNKLAPYALAIHKQNNHGFALEGAEFTLYIDANCTQEFAKGTTDTTGNYIFTNLIPEKNYYLKETKAPKGYRIPVNDDGSEIVKIINVSSVPVNDVFEFIMNENSLSSTRYVATTTQGVNSQMFAMSVSGTKADRICNLTVVNEVGMKLPETGSSLMIIVIIAGVALVGGAFLLSIKGNKTKKSKKEDN